MGVMEEHYYIDVLLFGAIGFLSWWGASAWDQGWLILFGLPWWTMFIVSVWRVMR
jgi:hypothetical protein